MELNIGDWVCWKWGTGVAEGTVKEIHNSRTEIVSKGTHIVRNGTKNNPAVIIVHTNGNEVIKLQSEITTTT